MEASAGHQDGRVAPALRKRRYDSVAAWPFAAVRRTLVLQAFAANWVKSSDTVKNARSTTTRPLLLRDFLSGAYSSVQEMRAVAPSPFTACALIFLPLTFPVIPNPVTASSHSKVLEELSYFGAATEPDESQEQP